MLFGFLVLHDKAEAERVHAPAAPAPVSTPSSTAPPQVPGTGSAVPVVLPSSRAKLSKKEKNAFFKAKTKAKKAAAAAVAAADNGAGAAGA